MKIVVVSISSPLLIGVYKDDTLIEEIKQDGKTSDILPMIFHSLLGKYSISSIYYVSSPGSYMAIKVAYIFLKTISIVKNIPLKAVSGFEFNNQSPIKALGKKYFIYDNNDIKVDFVDDISKIQPFSLPSSIKNIDILEDSLPSYNLPVV